MTQTIIAPHNRTLQFYGIGGGGINLVRAHIEGRQLNQGNGQSVEKYALIDSSLSNLTGATSDFTYTLRGNVDGSGGNPQVNAEAFQKELPDIMERFPAGDTNIVVFSNGGGSGSAGGPILIRHLLEMGHTVFAVMIGMTAAESLRTVRNCIVTMKNLELVVEDTQRPLVIAYAPLDPEKSYTDNNHYPLFVMQSLSVLASGKNDRIDRQDLIHFVDYHKVTPQEPALSILQVALKEDTLRAQGKVTTYLALMEDDSVPAPRIPADYAKHGLTGVTSGQVRSLYFTVQANLGAVYADISAMEKEVGNRRNSRVETTRLTGGAEQKDKKTGLIFD